MRNSFGANWQEIFEDFEWEPFAAASIGQVHRATYKGTPVAIKVQYPGVAESIESDLANLRSLVKWTNVLPKEIDADRLIEHIRQDLAEECDYIKEAKNQMEFYDLVNEPGRYRVPKVLLHTQSVLVSEYITGGITIDEIANLAPQKIRDSVAERILSLVCNEMFTWEFIQSDPNPSNFYYDPQNDELVLFDFGSCHHYRHEFIEAYRQVVIGGVNKDREKIKKYSIAMDFFTENETEELWDAHIGACLAFLEPLSNSEYNYQDSNIVEKVNYNIPIVLKHRKKSPPAEAWTLFRKLSGALMLSLKLRANIDGHSVYRKIILKA